MSDAFLGEIRMFGGDFAPRGWANCDGTLLATNQFPDLFNVIGTIYGGNGTTTFALPDMRGRIPVESGAGANLPARNIGEKIGEEQVTLTTEQIPAHIHAWAASGAAAVGNTPQHAALANTSSNYYTADSTKIVTMNSNTIGDDGNGQPHDNVMPSVGIRFIICLSGANPG